MGAPSFPCPCCGYRVFRHGPGSDERCPVCGWVDDLSQLRYAELDHGPNQTSLRKAQHIFLRGESSADGAHEPTSIRRDGWLRDPRWRPIDPTRDSIERPTACQSYGEFWPRDLTWLYYWRR
ncbi:MAG: CPCC family cysteine-rich protein [Burkholderiaceae bacterium]